MKVSAHTAILNSRSLASSRTPINNSDSRASSRRATKTPKTTDVSGASSGAQNQSASQSSAENEAGDDAKKRVRLKPETREQLLERLRNPPLSLHETSILLRVSRATVRRYADAGRLPCLRTPGGQRRFALRDIETFYRQHKTKR